MSVFVWGSKGFANHLGYVIQECPYCRNLSPFAVYDIGRKFTVYWIPTFSYGCKLVAECGVCRGSFEVAESCREKLSSALLSQEQLSDLLSGKTPVRSRQRFDRDEPEGPTVRVVEPERRQPEQPQSPTTAADDTRDSAPTSQQSRENTSTADGSDISPPSVAVHLPIVSPQPVEPSKPSTAVDESSESQIPSTLPRPLSVSQSSEADGKSSDRRSGPTWGILWLCVVASFFLAFISSAWIRKPTAKVKTATSAPETTIQTADVIKEESKPIVVATPKQIDPSDVPRLLRPHVPEVRPNSLVSKSPKNSGRGLESTSHIQQTKAETNNRKISDELTDWGNHHSQLKNFEDAVSYYRRAIDADPQNYRPKNNLARILATCPDAGLRDGHEAIRLALEAVEQCPSTNWQVYSVVAAAYAETKDFQAAIVWGRRAKNTAQGADQRTAEINLSKFIHGQPVRW